MNQEEGQRYIDNISQDISCSRKKAYVFIEDYKSCVIFYHKAHSDYVDRMTKSVNCECYYGILPVKTDPGYRDIMSPLFTLRRQKGRQALKQCKEYIDNLDNG